MASRSKRKKQLSYFYDHEDQEAKDLVYGAQKDACKKLMKKDTAFRDHSMRQDWTPDED